MTIDDNLFGTLADETLNHLLDVIDDELGDVLEVDMENGMLTIEAASGGQYIINKHAPNRQIWLSSPASGASHYDYDEGKNAWIDSRDGESLTVRLSSELSALTETSFSLD